jgi:hypothetical protein
VCRHGFPRPAYTDAGRAQCLSAHVPFSLPGQWELLARCGLSAGRLGRRLLRRCWLLRCLTAVESVESLEVVVVNGFYDASTDPAVIAYWWTYLTPGANVGARVPENMFAIDIDPRSAAGTDPRGILVFESLPDSLQRAEDSTAVNDRDKARLFTPRGHTRPATAAEVELLTHLGYDCPDGLETVVSWRSRACRRRTWPALEGIAP